jgi:hypothetical protein
MNELLLSKAYSTIAEEYAVIDEGGRKSEASNEQDR